MDTQIVDVELTLSGLTDTAYKPSENLHTNMLISQPNGIALMANRLGTLPVTLIGLVEHLTLRVS